MSEIVICGTCNGTGKTREDIGTHTSEYITHTCSSCKGTGRQRTRTYSYRVPYFGQYSDEMQLLYKIDSIIIKLIREFESEIKRKFEENGNNA